MSDQGAIGVRIHDLSETLSERYYGCGNNRVKSHIGFGLILLKDLVNLIESDGIDLYLDDLPEIPFYKNESVEFDFIKSYLNGEKL